MEINEMTHWLPSIQTEESDSYMKEEYFDFVAYEIEFERRMNKQDYQTAADAVTRLLELIKQNPTLIRWEGEDKLIELHSKRAYAYFMDGNMDAATKDLEWVEARADLSTERQTQMVRGLIQYLAGNGTTVLETAANRGDRMALLVLNQPENINPPKTEWMLLNREDRIQKLIEGRHYTAVIEEINKMEFPAHRWFSQDSAEGNWIALRGACQALRGHYSLAVEDLERANQHSWLPHYELEKAVIYSRAGRNNDALKILNQMNSYLTNEFHIDLVRKLIDIKPL